MGIAGTPTSPSSIPSLESSRNSNDHFRPLNFGVPVVNLPPRHIARQASMASSVGGRISRPASSGGLSGSLFHRGGDDDGDESSSYMYFLEGEVVMHRRPNTPGSVSGSQIQSTGSMDDNSFGNQNNNINNNNHIHRHHSTSTGSGRVPERIVMLPPPDRPHQDDDVSWDQPTPTGTTTVASDHLRQQLHSSPPQAQTTTMLGGGGGSPSHPVDPPETSALHAILQQTHETPRTDNLSQQHHSPSRVRAAPVFPSLSSSKSKK